MKTIGVIGLVWLVAGVCFGAKLPPSYKRCSRKSPDVDQCLAQALQGVLAGLDGPLPEIGLLSVEPVMIHLVHVPPRSSSSVAVDQKYKNGKLMGFKNSIVKQLKFDFRRKIMEWEIIVAPLTQIAEYELHGRILLFPVEGAGRSNVSCDKCTIHMTSPFVIIEKNGNKHLKFKNSVLKIYPEHINYEFENLFNGNKELGDNINRVLNDNWYQIFLEIRDGLTAAYGDILEGVANSVCAEVPLSEMFLDGF